MKIRTKLSIFPIALTVMLIVSLLIILIISNSTIKNQIGNHLQTTAQSRAHNIETLLNDDKDIVQILAAGIPFSNGFSICFKDDVRRFSKEGGKKSFIPHFEHHAYKEMDEMHIWPARADASAVRRDVVPRGRYTSQTPRRGGSRNNPDRLG